MPALRELRAAVYANALRALSADRVGPSADLSRLNLGEADVGASALATALQGAKATSRVDFSGEGSLGGTRWQIFTSIARRYYAQVFFSTGGPLPPGGWEAFKKRGGTMTS